MLFRSHFAAAGLWPSFHSRPKPNLRKTPVSSNVRHLKFGDLATMTNTTARGRLGQWGLEYVKGIVETGWLCIMQEFQGFRDVGMDGTVLDMRNGCATAQRFDIQVRTSEHFTRRPDGFSISISKEHRLLWSSSNLPMILVCVDASPKGDTQAYWRRIIPDDAAGGTIFVSRKKVFGPNSRGEVLSEVRRAAPPKELPAIDGLIFGCPLNVGLRPAAREWYRTNLVGRNVENPLFGKIEFTWQGWRHITRKVRPRVRIQSSLLILPSVRGILADPISPTHTRRLAPIRRGSYDIDRLLMIFERTVNFSNRSPAHIRVVVKQADRLPQDWARRPPDSPDRFRSYTFYSVEELPTWSKSAAG